MKLFDKEEKKNLKLSDQALGAIMMALQKSLMEQTDIVPVLKGFELEVDDNNEVIVGNPPSFKTSDTDVGEFDAEV